ncbi:membrane protein insertase YidC [Elongatibacter sediminis]|uniref:Membrane protein insertase YidC n=1 Tax=Elongatibacter sediminis TaxID=3119006 RepID=A0AAW9RI26_9GAMM
MKSGAFFAAGVAFALLLSSAARAQVEITTESLSLHFGAQGELLAAEACHPRCADPDARRQAISAPGGIVSFADAETTQWSWVRGLETRESVLSFRSSDGREVTWSIPESGYGVGLTVQGAGALMLRSGDSLKPRALPGFGGWLEQVRHVVIERDGAEAFGPGELDTETVRAEWAGVRSRFWSVLVSADRSSRFRLGVDADGGPTVLRGGKSEREELLLYIGPVEPRALAATDPLLRHMMYAGLWFWLRWICFALFYLLDAIHALVPVWGVAIVVLSFSVNFLMAPLSRAADRVQQTVHETEARLAPELTRIKQEFRGEEQAAKIIALYKTERVHPLYSLKSLVGVAIVIPVFIGAFDMLAEKFHLMHTPFLWISDLSRPDAFAALPMDLPFFGSSLNLLPFVMTALSIVASVMHRPLAQHALVRRRQVRNMIVLAAVFFVLFYTFPAGMVLYWTTNNLISVLKALWARFRPVTESH